MGREKRSKFANDAKSTADLASSLAHKANQTDVRLKTEKISQSDVTEEFLQQMAGTTPVNSIPQDKSVTPTKTDFLTPNQQNVFNPYAATDGYRLTSTGDPFADALYTLGDYIPVTSGQVIKIFTNNGSPTGRICGYNGSKIFLKVITAGIGDGASITVDFTGFIRVPVLLTAKFTTQIVDNSIYNGEFVPFEYGMSSLINTGVKSSLGYIFRVSKSGENFDIRTSFDSVKDIVISTVRNGSSNSAFTLNQTYLVNKNQAKLQGEAIHNAGDDIAPIRTFSTVGANHGYFNILGVTMTSHGKAVVDLGSKWTDGVTTYTLLQISGNNLYFGCPYTVTDGIVSSNYIAPIANLTHVSGATSTSAVNITTLISNPQLYPAINKRSVKYILDGSEITSNGIFYGNEFVIRESYNIMDYKALLDYAQTNIGVSYANDNVEGVVRVAIDYVFGTGGSTVIHHNYRALKKHSILHCGFMQSAVMSLTGHKVERYMPNVLPKSGVDFKSPVDLTTYNQSLIYTTADLIDPAIPPNRTVDWLKDTTSGARKAGFTVGYIVDKSSSKNSDRIANSAARLWDMRNSLKNYPNAIQGKTYNVGDYLNFIAYRNYLSPNVVPSDATNFNIIKDKKDTYVYIDYHTSVSFKNIHLDEHIGKTITVIEKSVDFTLHNDIVDADGVLFSVANNYGYAILKLA
jgi:hypothetical protein